MNVIKLFVCRQRLQHANYGLPDAVENIFPLPFPLLSPKHSAPTAVVQSYRH